MPGFGDSPFGDYKFGEVNWPRLVTWGSLPYRHQEKDAEFGYPQRTFLEGYEEELDEIRFKTRGVLDQRDPNRAIASDSAFTVLIDGSSVVSDAFWGQGVLVQVSSGEDFSVVGPGWICTVISSTDGTDIRTYKVLRVRTRNEPDSRNEILLRGVPQVLLNTEMVLRPPSLLKNLARDFNVIIDDEEPVDFQRSSVANAVALRNIKTNGQSYSIRGDMAGFVVSALGLWRVDPFPTGIGLSANTIYELPTGSGKFYTTESPEFISFDDIPGDIEFDDPDLGVISILDYDVLFDDPSGDEVSPGKAYAENVLNGFFLGEAVEPNTIAVTSVTAVVDPDPITGEVLVQAPAFDGVEVNFSLSMVNTEITPSSVAITTSAGGGSEDFTDNGSGILVGTGGGSGTIDYDTGDVTLIYAVAPAGGLTLAGDYTWDALKQFDLPNAFRVVATMTAGQRAKISTFIKGKFILVNDATESEHFIEEEEYFDSGGSEVSFVVSEPNPMVTGAYRIKYFPGVSPSCSWARANVMIVIVEATEKLILGFNGNGEKVSASFSRLETKIRRLIPTHVRLGAIVRKISAEVSGPLLDVSAKITDKLVAIVPMTAYYDDIEGDIIFTDDVGPVVSATVTEI